MDFLDDINKDLDDRSKRHGNAMDKADDVAQRVLAEIELSSVIKSVLHEDDALREALSDPKIEASINRKSATAVHSLVKKILKEMG